MLKQENKTKAGVKTKSNFIPPRNTVKDENFGLNKYMTSIPKPQKNEVHLLNYYYQNESVAFQINASSTKRLTKNEYDKRVQIKQVKGLVINKTSLNISESNILYKCLAEKEELEEDKLLENGSPS